MFSVASGNMDARVSHFYNARVLEHACAVGVAEKRIGVRGVRVHGSRVCPTFAICSDATSRLASTWRNRNFIDSWLRRGLIRTTA